MPRTTRTPRTPPAPTGISPKAPGIAGFDEAYWNDGYWNDGYWRRGTLGMAGPPVFTATTSTTSVQQVMIVGSWPSIDIGENVAYATESQEAAV